MSESQPTIPLSQVKLNMLLIDQYPKLMVLFREPDMALSLVLGHSLLLA